MKMLKVEIFCRFIYMFFPFMILADIEMKPFPFVPSSPSGRIAGHKEKISFVLTSKLHHGEGCDEYRS